MKIKDGFVIRKTAGCYVVFNQKGNADFKKMITLNETGALIWNGINEGLDEKQIATKITDEYDIDEKTALNDVCAFIARMKDADVLE